MHCFCVCSGSALWEILGDPWNVTVCPVSSLVFYSVYCTVFVFLLGTSCYVLFYNCFLHVCYIGLVVNTCQVIGWKDSSEDAYYRRLSPQRPG